MCLPGGRRVGLGEYVRSWKILLSTPKDTMVSGFDWYPSKAEDVLRELRRGLHDRINRHDERKGRKFGADWQRHLWLIAHRVNTPRLRVYKTELGVHGWLSAKLPNRFSVLGD